MNNTIIYTYQCGYTGNGYKCRVDNVASVTDEVYPPGGMLRVIRNASGQLLAGPLVSEITSWEEVAK